MAWLNGSLRFLLRFFSPADSPSAAGGGSSTTTSGQRLIVGADWSLKMTFPAASAERQARAALADSRRSGHRGLSIRKLNIGFAE